MRLTWSIRRISVWLVALGVAVTLAPAPAGATFPGGNGKLAFERAGDIWTGWGTSYPGGTWYERRLTFDGVSRNPRWSPDGTRIAFNTTTGAIKTMSPTGTEVRVVTTGRSYQPAWSPPMTGGRRIVFVKVPVDGYGDLWTVPATGGSATRLTTDGAANLGDSWPSWSPDGRRIVYRRVLRRADGTAGATQTVVLNLDTGRRRIVPVPRWDPSGGRYEVYLVRPDFTADGTRVLFAIVLGGDGCSQYLGWYDVRTGTTFLEDLAWYACEGGGWLTDVGPVPSGGIWRVWAEWEGDTTHIGYPRPGQTSAHASSESAVWRTPDVQPRP